MLDLIQVPELLVQVVIAVATGGLIGIERERRAERKFAGLRTLALLCGAGPIVVALSVQEGTVVFMTIYLGLAVAISLLIVYIRFSLTGQDVGLTTSVTVFLVALLGILIGFDRLFESTSIAIITVILLAERERLHGYVDSLTDRELSDSLKLGALAFILYPILPAEPIDPFGVVVLRDVLLFAIFVLLIEFVSYILLRQFGGSKGLAISGLLAGGANSFAAAGVLARLANKTPDATTAASFALLLATASMIVRNVGIAVVLAFEIFWLVWQPAVVMLLTTAALAGWLWYGQEQQTLGIEFDSPFSFAAAAKFSVAYVGILVASVVAEETLGSLGLYATAFAGGLASSAAVSVLAATTFTDGAASIETAVGMVVLGIMASLTSKIVLVEVTNREMGKRVAVPMILIGVAGIVVFVLT